jgi:HK97 family phage portal protein
MANIFERVFSRRAVSYQQIFASGDSIEFGTMSGTIVNHDTAFQVNAIYSAVSLIADTISTLPLGAFYRYNGARLPFFNAPAWVQQPDVDLPRNAFYSAVIVSLLLDGNAFIRVFSNPQGEVVNLVVLNPHTVEVKRNGLGRLMFTVQGEPNPLTGEEVVFIPDLLKPGSVRGVSRVEALKENFGLALALEKFASSFFGQGTNLSGIIEFPGDLTQEQADNLRSGFDKAHSGWARGHKTGILSAGAQWKPTQIDPDKSTLVESRNQAVADVARAFNVPPHLLALPGTNSYASVEQTNLAWVTHGLRPIVSKLEDALSPLLRRIEGGANAFLRFNLDGLLRADIQSRMSAYSVGLQSGFLSINDVRRLEDLAPVADASADTVRVPLANVNIDSASLSAENQKVSMAQKLILVGFDPAETLAMLGLNPIAHSGLPSSQLQPIAQIDPNNPSAAYEVQA